MRFLLDTHVLLWWLQGEPRLAARAALLRDEDAQVHVSPVSVWEITIKRALGKLEAPDDLPGILGPSSMRELPVMWRHAAVAGSLPPHHRDPFDRMLVAQAQVEGLTLVTDDERLSRYDVRVLAAG